MGAVHRYLPSPLEKEPVETIDQDTNIVVKRHPDKKDKLCALAFKVRLLRGRLLKLLLGA